jgi:hypothetical protein
MTSHSRRNKRIKYFSHKQHRQKQKQPVIISNINNNLNIYNFINIYINNSFIRNEIKI